MLSSHLPAVGLKRPCDVPGQTVDATQRVLQLQSTAVRPAAHSAIICWLSTKPVSGERETEGTPQVVQVICARTDVS